MLNGNTGLTGAGAQSDHARVMTAQSQTRSQRANGILRGLDMLLIPPMLDSQVGREEVIRLAVEASNLLRTHWCSACSEYPAEEGTLCGPCFDDRERAAEADAAQQFVIDGWR